MYVYIRTVSRNVVNGEMPIRDLEPVLPCDPVLTGHQSSRTHKPPPPPCLRQRVESEDSDDDMYVNECNKGSGGERMITTAGYADSTGSVQTQGHEHGYTAGVRH